jgi:hypothetical protein
LNLNPHAPDLLADWVFASYAPGPTIAEPTALGVLSVLGWSAAFDLDGLAPPDYFVGGMDTSYMIDLTVGPGGVPLGGSLSALGTVSEVGANSGTLLTGDIMDFGFIDPPGGDVFEFVFAVTGGDLAPYYGPKAYVVMNLFNAGFDGTFATEFYNDGLGVADTYGVVPEPGHVGLLLLGLFTLTRLAGPLGRSFAKCWARRRS